MGRLGAVAGLLSFLVGSGFGMSGPAAYGVPAELPAPIVHPFSLGLKVAPRHLPERGHAPARLTLTQRIAAPDGSHPPALKEERLELDRNIHIDARGVPTCHGGSRAAIARGPEEFREICRDAQVGHGSMRVEVLFADQPPVTVTSQVRIGNGGSHGGLLTLYIYSYLPAPVLGAIVTEATIDRGARGRYRNRVHLSVPQIGRGAGSIVRFELILGSRIVSAGCRDGLLLLRASAKFSDNTTRRQGEAARCQRRRATKRRSAHGRRDL